MGNPSNPVQAGAEVIAGAMAGGATSGLAGAAWGGALPILERVLYEIGSRSWRVLAEHAADDEESLVALVSTLSGTASGQELLARALDAARWTTLDDKLRAFGRTLAAATGDDARIDEEILLVQAVDALSVTHIRVLRILSRTQGENGLARRGQIAAGRGWELRTYDAEDICEVDPALRGDVLPFLMGVLIGNGLVTVKQYITYGEDLSGPRPIWEITKFGQLVVKRCAAAQFANPRADTV